MWVELDKEFDYFKKVIYAGKYNVNGNKTDLWNILHLKDNKKEFKQMYICIREYIVVEDHMIKKEFRKRWESGQNWMNSFQIIIKLFIMASTIQIV
ncbi:unnamed protein product [Paramecium sonneborni]|uniref:Uncharacterized protein n=1 Tax=Paramecium sonneborni TaxID=65129 RepID=A0A8S1RQ02_9CILI|nr:unnamed protein product [Paramecium sonneborni]